MIGVGKAKQYASVLDKPLGRGRQEAHKKYGGMGTLLVNKVSAESANQFGELVADPETNELLHYTEKPETFVSTCCQGWQEGVSCSYMDIPNTQIRKVTANRLLTSKQTIPHYYLTVDTCVDKLIKLRGELNPLQDVAGGKKISINDLVIKAAALALRKVPQCNSSWMNDFIRQYHNVNINVAVQTEHGLFVPVIRDADKKGLGTIAEDVKQLAQRARDNSLKPEDYEGGTFTVSNLGGPFGIKQFCAIINPQSAILAIGSAEKRVIPGGADGQYEFGSYMSATLSCDHRVIDGGGEKTSERRECKARGTVCDVREGKDVKALVDFARNKLKYIDIWAPVDI